MANPSKQRRPGFRPGKNIAMKIPAHEFDATLGFYRDVLGFMPITGTAPGDFRLTDS